MTKNNFNNYREFLEKGGEEFWQKKWEKEGIFEAKNDSNKPKYYCLIEFPYPSGEGLHVGHPRSYIAMDVIARKRRMQGFNVLYPIGWDAFGLPAENYAIKTGIHPAVSTKKNIANFKRQLKMLGYSFDWSREFATTDPEYYKWTQWMFLKFFEHGLAYKDKIAINWCPSCRIGLANEEVVDGKCERCGNEVGKRMKEQWMIRITKYAERLLNDLDKVDYLPQIKEQQKNWIGKSVGAKIKFEVIPKNRHEEKNIDLSKNSQHSYTARNVLRESAFVQRSSATSVEVFTTRPDTLFGATYMVLSPEHELIGNLKSEIRNWDEVEKYIKKAAGKSDLERTELQKDKTGVELKGVKAINPVNNEEIPIWVADYVLASYGTGAIMAVPAHDERDFEFAKKFGLAIKEVVKAQDIGISRSPLIRGDRGVKSISQNPTPQPPFRLSSRPKPLSGGKLETAFSGEGTAVNSDFLNGLETGKAKEKMINWLEEKGAGKRAVNYKLRDWVFSRQRYWGEPIPLVYCEQCGWVPVPEKDLPVKLPEVEKYEPTETGESPLANISEWVNTKCLKCGGAARRETDTMPNWAGSSWYFLRYTDSKNNKIFAGENNLKYWMPVDWYNGGMEHTTLHLLYSRFWYKFLYDIGEIPESCGDEPYKKRTSQGMILGEGGEKMSKSRGNVINPDDVVAEHGADTFRVYEMFMGPFDQAIPWDTKGVVGCKRFLEKIWKLQTRIQSESKANRREYGNLEKLLHKTIKKVTEDIEEMKFNTAISQMMILVNEMEKQEELLITNYQLLINILSPFAPFIAEEIWHELGNKKSIHLENWPEYDEELVKDKEIVLVVQVNGKVRDNITVPADISEKEARKLALNSEKIKKYLTGEPKKIIFVPGKLVNIVN